MSDVYIACSDCYDYSRPTFVDKFSLAEYNKFHFNLIGKVNDNSGAKKLIIKYAYDTN